jgi:hypothetical protein
VRAISSSKKERGRAGAKSFFFFFFFAGRNFDPSPFSVERFALPHRKKRALSISQSRAHLHAWRIKAALLVTA